LTNTYSFYSFFHGFWYKGLMMAQKTGWN